MPVYKRQPTKETERKFFTDIRDRIPLPDLIEVQKESYKWFFEDGMKELFEEVSPITDFTGRDLELYFEDYYIDEPKFDEVTCREKNITFEAPLRVVTRLVNKRTGKEDKQEIYLGDIPVMTDRGTFVVNGIERVVVSQLIRSPGAFFTAETVRGRRFYGGKVIPNRGAWIEVETDQNNVIWIKVDRKRKVAATSLLRAFGMGGDEEILKAFVDVDIHPNIKYIENTLQKDVASNEDEGLIEVYKRIRPGDLATADNARGLIHAMFFNFDRYDLGKVGVYKFNTKFNLALDKSKFDSKEERVLSPEKLVQVLKEVVRLNVSQEEPDDIDHLGNRRVRSIGELVQNRFRVGMARMERIVKDRMSTYEIESLNPNKLINARPVIGAVREFFMSSQLSQFMDQTNPLAELEHKRRLSAMGPGGLTRERAGFEVRDVHTTHYSRICPIATPEGPNIGLVGHMASYARLNSYGFLEAPYRKILHDVENKTKVTLGKILREDVFEDHSAEKKGKVVAKAGVRIDEKLAKELEKLGPITIPIKPVVTDEVVYLDAFEEEKYITTFYNTPRDENGHFLVEKTEVRKYGEPSIAHVETIDFIEVAANQIVSIATSCIPFLEHDDGIRALMGTNMQRQAVPLIAPEAPIVGTGMERRAAVDSGHVAVASEAGEVVSVQGNRIVIKNKDGREQEYPLNKFVRSNHSTCINQHPRVSKGAAVKKGDVLSDGAAIDNGEVALGRNVLVAFMTWDGFNYEDAIIISERMVREDFYSSIHIEDYTIDVRDTKLGPEVVTRDIPNI